MALPPVPAGPVPEAPPETDPPVPSVLPESLEEQPAPKNMPTSRHASSTRTFRVFSPPSDGTSRTNLIANSSAVDSSTD